MAEQVKDEEKKVEMEYRMLGNTGLKVSVLGLGTMSFDSEEQAIALMSTVRKHGVNFFDNAELYGLCHQLLIINTTQYNPQLKQVSRAAQHQSILVLH